MLRHARRHPLVAWCISLVLAAHLRGNLFSVAGCSIQWGRLLALLVVSWPGPQLPQACCVQTRMLLCCVLYLGAATTRCANKSPSVAVARLAGYRHIHPFCPHVTSCCAYHPCHFAFSAALQPRHQLPAPPTSHASLHVPSCHPRCQLPAHSRFQHDAITPPAWSRAARSRNRTRGHPRGTHPFGVV